MSVKERVKDIKERFRMTGDYDEIPIYNRDFIYIIAELERLWKIEECAKAVLNPSEIWEGEYSKLREALAVKG